MQQKIVKDYPPNFEEIAKAFPGAHKKGVIFSYGDKIYAPNGSKNITEHLVKHEAVHGERQITMGVEKWWHMYIVDPVFRYDEELLAHRIEYQSMIEGDVNRQQRRSALKIVAKRLSSSLYQCRASWKTAAADILEGL